MSLWARYTGASCMSTNTIIISCNAALSALITILTLSPCTKKTTGGFVPALLQSAIGTKASSLSLFVDKTISHPIPVYS